MVDSNRKSAIAAVIFSAVFVSLILLVQREDVAVVQAHAGTHEAAFFSHAPEYHRQDKAEPVSPLMTAEPVVEPVMTSHAVQSLDLSGALAGDLQILPEVHRDPGVSTGASEDTTNMKPKENALVEQKNPDTKPKITLQHRKSLQHSALSSSTEQRPRTRYVVSTEQRPRAARHVVSKAEMFAADAQALREMGQQSAALRADLKKRVHNAKQQMQATRAKAARIEAGKRSFLGPEPPWATSTVQYAGSAGDGITGDTADREDEVALPDGTEDLPVDTPASDTTMIEELSIPASAMPGSSLSSSQTAPSMIRAAHIGQAREHNAFTASEMAPQTLESVPVAVSVAEPVVEPVAEPVVVKLVPARGVGIEVNPMQTGPELVETLQTGDEDAQQTGDDVEDVEDAQRARDLQAAQEVSIKTQAAQRALGTLKAQAHQAWQRVHHDTQAHRGHYGGGHHGGGHQASMGVKLFATALDEGLYARESTEKSDVVSSEKRSKATFAAQQEAINQKYANHGAQVLRAVTEEVAAKAREGKTAKESADKAKANQQAAQSEWKTRIQITESAMAKGEAEGIKVAKHRELKQKKKQAREAAGSQIDLRAAKHRLQQKAAIQQAATQAEQSRLNEFKKAAQQALDDKMQQVEDTDQDPILIAHAKTP